MQVKNYSETRANFKSAIKNVVDCEPLLVTSKSGDVVIISRQDYDSMLETTHLLSHKESAQRLAESIASCELEALNRIGEKL